jgi:hypothetical protein
MSDQMEAWSSDDLEADADDAPKPKPSQELPHDAGTQSGRSMLANGESQAGPTQNGPDATVSGGRGDALFSDERRTKTDLNMTRKAIRSGWNVPDSAKPRIVGRLVTIVDQSPDDGDAIKAASVLRAMDSQDQDLAIKEHELARVDNGQQNQAIKLYGHEAPTHLV